MKTEIGILLRLRHTNIVSEIIFLRFTTIYIDFKRFNHAKNITFQ